MQRTGQHASTAAVDGKPEVDAGEVGVVRQVLHNALDVLVVQVVAAEIEGCHGRDHLQQAKRAGGEAPLAPTAAGG